MLFTQVKNQLKLQKKRYNTCKKKVFEITGKNCKNNKLYREKIHKYLHNRLTGTKNSFIRIALFNGKLSVKDLCVLSHNVYSL